MEYKEFYNRFGGSYRKKHLKKDMRRLSNIVRMLKGKLDHDNKRAFKLPAKSELPIHFIRLEPWEGEYLFYLAKHAKLGIVETGRFHGGSTFVMSCANDKVPFHSIDIAPKNDGYLKELFAKFGIGKNTDLIVGDSQKSRYEQIKQFDLLFIDGDHSYQGCTNDLENWYPLLAPGGHVVLHDCYHGSEVKESVIDFVTKHRDEVQLIAHPYKNHNHWFNPEGSFAHFIKK